MDSSRLADVPEFFDLIEDPALMIRGRDALDAGTNKRMECTLVIVQNWFPPNFQWFDSIDSARIGILPVCDQFLNVTAASREEIENDEVIIELVHLLGIRYGERYYTHDDLVSLRYGRVLVAADPHITGSYFKGLVINFFNHYWEHLLQLNFIELMILPAFETYLGLDSRYFFTLPELLEWRTAHAEARTYNLKIHNYLNSFTPLQIAMFLNNKNDYKIALRFYGSEDRESIRIAYSGDAMLERRRWMTIYMNWQYFRPDDDFRELCLYRPEDLRCSYKNFIQWEMSVYGAYNNIQSIPHVIDGLKPTERKIISICFDGTLNEGFLISGLIDNYIMMVDRIREPDILDSILSLSQRYFSLLEIMDERGNIQSGDIDYDILRQFFIRLTPLARILFNQDDFISLKYKYTCRSGRMEPVRFIPIVPLILINGAEGSGTGWNTKIYTYDPRDIIENILELIDGRCGVECRPYFENFEGTMEPILPRIWLTSGNISVTAPGEVTITELPIGMTAEEYRETVLERMRHFDPTDSSELKIENYEDLSYGNENLFIVEVNARALARINEADLPRIFQLETTISTEDMFAIGEKPFVRDFGNMRRVLAYFFVVRHVAYKRRRSYLLRRKLAEIKKYENQIGYISENLHGSLKSCYGVENITEMIIRMRFDPDPVGKLMQELHNEVNTVKFNGFPEYDYLVNMSLPNISIERMNQLLTIVEHTKLEVQLLQIQAPNEIWKNDLLILEQEMRRIRPE